MIVGGFCKRASNRAAKQLITGTKKDGESAPQLGSALRRDGIVAVFSTSAWAIIADTSWAESTNTWIKGSFGKSPACNKHQQLHVRKSSEAQYSERASNKSEGEVCSTSSRTTDFKPLERQVISTQRVLPRNGYFCFSSRSFWGSVPRRNCFHREGGGAAGLESSSSPASADDQIVSVNPDDIINLRPGSEEVLQCTTEVNVEGEVVPNECEFIEERNEVVGHLQQITTATEATLWPYQTLGLPKINNSTTKVIETVCSILEVQEWGPDTSKKLEDVNLVFTPFLIQQITRAVSSKNVHSAWNFFKWARANAGVKLGEPAHIAILDSLGRFKEFETMKEAFALVFEDGHRKSVWPYNNALKWCSAAGNVEAATYFWDTMKENNCRPTVVTYTRLIDLLATQGRHQEALEIFRQMLQANCPPNISTYNVLIRAFGTAGQPEVAESLFDRLSELGCKPNYITYSTLISLHVEAGKPEKAVKYFNMMNTAGIGIGNDVSRTLQLSLPSIKDVPEGSASQENMGSLGIEDQPTILSAGRVIDPSNLVKLLVKGEPLSVEAKLEKIKPQIDPRFVTQVLRRLKNPDTAITFFNWAKDQPHFKHNEYSYSMMISILGRSRNNEALDRIMKEMQEQHIRMSTPILTALITCYGRANDLEGALKVFGQMKEWGCLPDVITYTSVIHLLAKYGSHEPAINMFEEMKQAGIDPNMHTYSVMIYTFLKAGKVTEAVDLLKRMPDLGCQPSPITFATIIDRCAKEGQVEMAKDLFSQMEEQGVKPLKTTIKALGAALRKAGMTEDANRITQKFRSRQIWDEKFKSFTVTLADELLFKDSAMDESSTLSVAAKC